jgi:hypothetical protein
LSGGARVCVLAVVAALGSAARAEAPAPAKDAGAPPDEAAAREKTRRILDILSPGDRDALLGSDPDGLRPFYADLRDRVRAKRAEVDARAKTEAALPHPDKKKLSRLRRTSARLAAEEQRLTRALAEVQREIDRTIARLPRFFDGVKVIDQEQLDGIFH